MIREVQFESQDRRIEKINSVLNKYGIKNLEDYNVHTIIKF